ncbi:cyclic nucleotide-binding protein [Sinobacterium caligoides]|uniref:Cyclic nucleotide-binding protein n=1 Tax=Sinobacterium caligoides TaxID=933926 RepID=A0A3N2DQE4_9GAMM|nr:cyclic nucleotide-binding domain-containing protein [Sinobacterium caligoides]ROS02013.1 cyclic nucleotide-binding protein [Sinobacterium caligoides]
MITTTELRAFSPFENFDETQLSSLLATATLKEHKAGDTIIGKNAHAALRHYLIEGSAELKLSFFERSIIDTSQQALEELTPADSQMIANSACTLLCLQAQSIERCLQQNAKLAQQASKQSQQYQFAEPEIDWMNRFLESPLVQQLSAGTIGKLFSTFTDIEIEAGDSIFSAGDEPDAFYVIKQGRAEIKTQSYSSDKGSTIPLIAGDYFGEEALLGGTVRNATIFMPRGGVVGRMSREDFLDTLKPALIQQVEDNASLDFGPDTDNILVDPRLFLEYQLSARSHSVNIPVALLRQKLPELDPHKTYYIAPEGGERSELAAYMMRHAGLNTYLIPSSN